MLSWLSANIGTIVITFVLLVIISAVILVMRKDKKNGKCSCGGNCGHCPMGSSCHHNH